MFAQYLGLQHNPFELRCDSSGAFFYQNFQAAYDTLISDINGKSGIVLLLGPPGVGKSTLIRRVIEDIGNNKSVHYNDARLIEHLLKDGPEPSSEFLNQILMKHAGQNHSSKIRSDKMPAQAKKHITVIDHTNILDNHSLEKLITLEFSLNQQDSTDLLILLGHPALETRLQTPELAFIGHSICHKIHLQKLGAEELLNYIDSRLKKAGKAYDDFFSVDDQALIYELSSGIPGRINSLCAAAMVYITIEGVKTISRAVLEEVSTHCLSPNDMDNSTRRNAGSNLEPVNNPVNSNYVKENTEQTLPDEAIAHRQHQPLNRSSQQLIEPDSGHGAKGEQQPDQIRKEAGDFEGRVNSLLRHSLSLFLLGCLVGVGISFLFMNYQRLFITKQTTQSLQNGNMKTVNIGNAMPAENQPSPESTDDATDISRNQLSLKPAPAQTMDWDFVTLEPSGAGVTTNTIVDFTLKQNRQAQKHDPTNLQNSEATTQIHTPDDGSNIVSDQIALLLAQAEEQKRNFQYSLPAGNNALETFRQVLELDADNKQGRLGIQEIKQRYVYRAKLAAAFSDWKYAVFNLERALYVTPDDQQIISQLADLRNKMPLQQKQLPE